MGSQKRDVLSCAHKTRVTLREPLLATLQAEAERSHPTRHAPPRFNNAKYWPSCTPLGRTCSATIAVANRRNGTARKYRRMIENTLFAVGVTGFCVRVSHGKNQPPRSHGFCGAVFYRQLYLKLLGFDTKYCIHIIFHDEKDLRHPSVSGMPSKTATKKASRRSHILEGQKQLPV